MDKIYDVLIIGGGASGLFLAANLKSKSVAVLEKNQTAGKKILASGGGRCNVTNRYITAQNYLGNEILIDKILSFLSFNDVLEFFSELKFEEIKQNQFFCKSSAKDILRVLLGAVLRAGGTLFYGCDVNGVSKISSEIFEISTKNGEKFRSKCVVVASGSVSYKALGASDIGYEIAKKFDLSVSKISPALVGFTVQKDEFWFKNLSGVSLKAKFSLDEKNLIFSSNFKDKIAKNLMQKREIQGDVLFTHRGISGPAVLNASLFWDKGIICIDFLPNFDFKNLSQKKQLSTILPLPKRFVLEFLSSLNLKDKPFCEYNKHEFEQILRLKCYEFAPAGTFGFERAEVSKGGVMTDGLDENLACKNEPNLYFIGEVLDITGMLGGYNIHFAFASAKALSSHLNAKQL